MNLNISLTRRNQRRKQKDGSMKSYTRYVLNFTEPGSEKRRQLFFDKRDDARDMQRQLLVEFETGDYLSKKDSPTIREAFESLIEYRRPHLKERTFIDMHHYRRSICGPLLVGTRKQRFLYTQMGKVPPGAKLLPMLGDIKVAELTTAQIRAWYILLTKEISTYTAQKSKQYLQASLILAAEDHPNIRLPPMPRELGRQKRKEKKKILTQEEVQKLIAWAKENKKWGLYIAFPFLTGVRPAELLGLCWDMVDFERNLIKVHRVLERGGEVGDMTKTESSTRSIPISKLLREWLLEWRERCPRKEGELKFVFPSQFVIGEGNYQAYMGGPLIYANFRRRVWANAFKQMEKIGVPYVTPHSARHYFISALQACGVEVALAAKLAGHSSLNVTLKYYSQAMRGGEDAIEKLANLFQNND